MPDFYKQIIENNRKWVAAKLNEDPEFFSRLASGQKPPLFWIGCADSRVPANEITGTQAGEVFVHRNIANMVVHSDMNMLSTLDFAVNILKVQHVIVCGHYRCGGIEAAMGNAQHGLIDNWILHIKDVYRIHQAELDAIQDQGERSRRFVELNVVEQVNGLAHTSIIQNAWKERQGPYLHGWAYDVRNGLVNDLKVTVSDNSNFQSVYKLNQVNP